MSMSTVFWTLEGKYTRWKVKVKLFLCLIPSYPKKWIMMVQFHVLHTILHVQFVAKYLLFTAPTCFGHIIWPSSGSSKLLRPIKTYRKLSCINGKNVHTYWRLSKTMLILWCQSIIRYNAKTLLNYKTNKMLKLHNVSYPNICGSDINLRFNLGWEIPRLGNTVRVRDEWVPS